MKLYLKRKNKSVEAIAEYDVVTKNITILKGSVISEKIAYSNSFRGAKSIENARGNGVVMDRILTKDLTFKSASTAANFVTGASTNGMIAWKNEAGKTLKSILTEGDSHE